MKSASGWSFAALMLFSTTTAAAAER